MKKAALLMATLALGYGVPGLDEGPPKEHDEQKNNRFKGQKRYRRGRSLAPGERSELKEKRRLDRKAKRQARKRNR